MKQTLVVALLALAVAACSGDDTAEPSTTAPSTRPPVTLSPPSTTASTTDVPSTLQAPSTTAAPSTVAPTTSAPITSPPTPPSVPVSFPFPITDAGQPDWVPIIQGLLETGIGLSLGPNVDQITAYCLANSECYQDWLAYIENLIDDDAHAEGLVADRVLSVEIGRAQGDRDPIETGAVVLTAQVEVVGNEPGARVADSAGNTIYLIERDAQPGDIVSESYFLGLNPDNEWRVVQESTSESG